MGAFASCVVPPVVPSYAGAFSNPARSLAVAPGGSAVSLRFARTSLATGPLLVLVASQVAHSPKGGEMRRTARAQAVSASLGRATARARRAEGCLSLSRAC